jgi:hypothetical protein
MKGPAQGLDEEDHDLSRFLHKPDHATSNPPKRIQAYPRKITTMSNVKIPISNEFQMPNIKISYFFLLDI